jgi:adenylate cyclase
MERRLSAILAADVVGYSALMEADEAGTFAQVRAGRKELFEPEINKHHGRIFKLMGDGLLAEFGSVGDAVECAVSLQRGMVERNASVPEGKRIEVRIGINLGEVIVEGEDCYGEGVNIAARLQELAEPGGICVSEKVSKDVEKKLTFGFEPMGERIVKNIAEPVRIYRVAGRPRVSVTTTPKAATDKPTIAVMPFVNMSGDPEQEYFTDGLTEDIITELSRFRNLLVVARNSAFTFKGQAVDVKEISRKLGAHYVVEGSVRRAGNRIRITAQLLESTTGNHLWAERYDREMEDIFAVQDELVRAISGVIPGQLDRYAVESLRRKPPDNFTAYDSELRGRWALTHWNEGLSVALEWFEKSIKADPDYALAHAGIALVYAYQIFAWSLDTTAHGLSPESTIARAKEYAQRATVLDDRNPTVQAYAGLAYLLSCEHELSRKHAERAVALNPNDSYALFVKANVLTYAGEMQEALGFFAKSERLEPYAPDDQRLDFLCDCHYMLHNYDKVIEIHSAYQNVPAFLYLILAAAAAQLGRQEQARAAVKNYERLRPAGHDAVATINHQMRMCWRQQDRDHWLDGYRKAGIQV